MSGQIFSPYVLDSSLLISYLCQTFPFDPHDSKEVDNVSCTNEAKSFAAGCAVSEIVRTQTWQSGADTGVPL